MLKNQAKLEKTGQNNNFHSAMVVDEKQKMTENAKELKRSFRVNKNEWIAPGNCFINSDTFWK